ncbi:MAG: hypothetical protein KY459_13160 [Acidobacteria bacterium]|nr:hypothetical protein [Acidobacteriota bacterium]
MRKILAVAAISGAAIFMAGNAEAQATDSNWVQVTATVQGVFDFKIDGNDYPAGSPALHDFGSVTVTGVQTGGTAATSIVTAADGSTAHYRAEPAFGWTVVSAPRRTVDISYQNATIDAANTMTIDQLAIEMSVTQQADGGAGTSTAWNQLSGAKTLLVDDALAGNGTNTAAGNINLELRVDENDAEGANTFTFELYAEGI